MAGAESKAFCADTSDSDSGGILCSLRRGDSAVQYWHKAAVCSCSSAEYRIVSMLRTQPWREDAESDMDE